MFIISTLHCGEAPRGRVEKREILSHHSVEICKFFPHDILQKFRQINYFTKEFYCNVNQFDEKLLQWWGKISEISTLCLTKTSA